MGSEEFMKFAKEQVVNFFNSKLDFEDVNIISYEDTYIVWSCYILGNQKVLISTTVPDGRYYEVTYDKNRDRTYVDVYKKEFNHIVHNNEI